MSLLLSSCRVVARERSARPPRVVFRALGMLFVAAPVVVLPAAATAQSSGGDKRQELQDQIGDASAQELQALQELQRIRDEKAAIDVRVAELDQRISEAQDRLAARDADARRLAGEYEKVHRRLAAAQSRLDDAQRMLDSTAAQMYRSARNGSHYDATWATPPEAIVRSDAYLDTISAKRRRIVRRVERLRNDVEAKRRAVEADKRNADAARAAVQAERDNIGELRAEIEPARTQAAERQAAEEQALASIQARKAEFEGELAALEAASASVTELLAGGSRGTASNPCDARPVPGQVRSGFGPRVHPIYGTTRLHSGIDMAGAMGDPIRSCRAGTVIQVGWNGGYGNSIVVDHGGGMATLYAHQSSLVVGLGARVEAGTVIGYVGSTGASTGPHLHFEVRLNGDPVNPVPYL